MPNPTSQEAAEIEAAYKEQLRALFKTLFNNLTDQPATHQTDQQCADKFKAALKIAKRARELALNAVSASPAPEPPSVGAQSPATELAARPKKGKKA